MEELRITHVYDKQPGMLHIKLEKNSRGFNWEVSYAHEDEEVALQKVRDVNEKLKAEFGQENAN